MKVPVQKHLDHAGRFLDIQGQRVFIREHGLVGSAEAPALLVHGHFGSGRQWSPLMNLLGKAVRCVAVDLPGFGQTPIARSVSLFSAALYRLCLGANGLRRRLSRMDAAQLARSLLSESCHDIGSLSRAVVEIATLDAGEALRSRWRFATEAASFRALSATLLRSVLPTNFSLRRMASQLKIPTLIMWGANDRTLPVQHAHALAKLMPGAKLAVLPVTGHAPHLEAPHRAAALIGSYIIGRSSAGSPMWTSNGAPAALGPPQ